jgi:DNA-binding NarL/FixJ family response regulator
MEATLLSTNNINGRSGNMPHILILECELLLGAGLKSLLAEETTLNIRGISANNRVELLEQIVQLQPDVIVLDALSSLVEPGQLLTAFNTYSKSLRLLAVNTNDNQVCIYDRRQILLTRAHDMIELMLGC